MRRRLAVVLVGTVLVAGCGGASDPEAEGPRRVSAAPASPTDDQTQDGTPTATSPPTTPPPTPTPTPTPRATTADPPAGQVPLEQVAVTLEPVADGFTQPVGVTVGADGATYVVDQPGVVWRLQDDAEPTAWLDLGDRVTFEGERGLLDVLFTPDGQQVVAHYSGDGGATTVSAFALTDGEVDAAAEQVLWTYPQPASNHNGGELLLAPGGDAVLLGLGDGGGADDRFDQAQDTSTPLGGIVRFPLADVADGSVEPALVAHGLRNPWRIALDDTGQLYVADVGQDQVEEVTIVEADVLDQGVGEDSADFGWPRLEGTTCFATADCDRSGTVLPDVTYTHDETDGCSVIGGAVVPDGALRGAYLYGDLCAGFLRALRAEAGEVVETTDLTEQVGGVGGLTSIDLAADGTPWLTLRDGRVLRLDAG